MNRIIQQDLETIFASNVDWDKFMDSTVLITGANGFLPAYIVESLLYVNSIHPKYNIKVVALVRSIEKAQQRFSNYIDNSNLEFLVQDVSEPINFFKKIDYIIHAASQASPKYYGTDPVGTLKANIIGTLNLLEIARKNKVKSFLYFSSGEVYGEVEANKIPIREDTYGYLDPLKVRSCYAESKRMGENLCVSFYHQHGVPAKIVRPFHTYGPMMKLDDGRVYADFVSNVINGENISINGDGKATRAFCYLSDATTGFFKVLLDGVNGEAYNIGNPSQEYTIGGLARVVANLYPEKKLEVNIQKSQKALSSYLASSLQRNSPDINKMELLNWRPVVTVEEGFRNTIESYNLGL